AFERVDSCAGSGCTCALESRGGQSAGTRSFDSPRGPSQSWASSVALLFGLCSGHSGKRDSVGCEAESTSEIAGDIAHLEDRTQYFAFPSPCQEHFRPFFVYGFLAARNPRPSRVFISISRPQPTAGPRSWSRFDRSEAILMKRLFVLLGTLAVAFLVLPALSPSSSSAVSAMPGSHVFKLYCA